MPDDLQTCNSTVHSPRRLAKKIESCIFRNALEEEQRAQKALYVLQARDRRIAMLEKRVAELEDTAANLHEITLRNSSASSILERNDRIDPDFPQGEKSFKTDNRDVANDKSNDISSGSNSTRENFVEGLEKDGDTTMNSEMSIPCLDLSKSSVSDSERDIFSTAIDFVMENRKCFTSNTSYSNEEVTSEMMTRREKFRDENLDRRSIAEARTKYSEKKKLARKNSAMLKEVMCKDENENTKGHGLTLPMGKSEEKFRDVSIDKQGESNCVRLSSSVPWIRAKNHFRKKLRGFEVKNGRKTKELLLPPGNRDPSFVVFRTVERGSTDGRQGDGETVADAKNTKRSTLNREQSGLSLADAQEKGTDQKTNFVTKTICTQTSIEALHVNEKYSNDNKITTDENNFSPSCVYMKQKKSSAFWCIDEDPAPQWLIEEALNRGTERIEQRTKGNISSNKEAEYERIILELEAKLALTKEKFEEALKTKIAAKEKYKKSLENIKAEARRENEILQERIVRICTSVLENFGPRSNERRSSGYQIKSYRKLKCHERITSKLHKKLRMAVARSKKLKGELAAARRTLKNKLEEHDSISKCFDQLKQDMETTETNLNDLISENLSLRRKIDDTRDWLQHTVGKEHCSGNFREVYKSRELTNLKKKVKEDSETISQLKNKLARSESANANKGFLLNSYKAQLTDLTKEKSQLVSRISNLENEIGNIRSSNSQLRAKISILNEEKDKMMLDVEKSKTSIKEKVETQCAKKCEETVQQEIEVIKTKYEETIKTMKTKILVSKNQNLEYLNAIKEFLNKLHEHQGNCEMQKTLEKSETCERETEEVICNILNITPEELSRITDAKSQDSVNSWIAELNRITATSHFSKDLSKFLLRKVTKTIKT